MPAVPQSGYTSGACTTQSGYRYLIDPNGNIATTQAQIQQACTTTITTPTGNHVCGDGLCTTGETSLNCPSDCSASTPLPNTAIISDDVDRLIAGIGLIVVGFAAVIYHRSEVTKHGRTKLTK